MHKTCLFCNRHLGANEAIENFHLLLPTEIEEKLKVLRDKAAGG